MGGGDPCRGSTLLFYISILTFFSRFECTIRRFNGDGLVVPSDGFSVFKGVTYGIFWPRRPVSTRGWAARPGGTSQARSSAVCGPTCRSSSPGWMPRGSATPPWCTSPRECVEPRRRHFARVHRAGGCRQMVFFVYKNRMAPPLGGEREI